MLVSGPLFFTTWDPQNRYHKLFRCQNGSVLGFKTGSKTGSHFGTDFFFSVCRFYDFLHTTSSASRIAPAISKPHFHLSSTLLFLLSLRPPILKLFGYKTIPKMDTKTNPKLDPSKRRAHPKNKNVFQKGSELVPQKGGPVKRSPHFCCMTVFC